VVAPVLQLDGERRVKAVLVRDLALERWPSMDRYAEALASRIPGVFVPPEWRMGGPRYLTRYWRYPRALRQHTGDLVHVLDHSYAHCLAAYPRLPSVVTVHDLLPLHIVADGGRSLRARVRDGFLRWVLAWVGRADRLIVSTAFTAREAETHLHIEPGRLRVVPYGVDPHFFVAPTPGEAEARRAGWRRAMQSAGASTRIILHVGSCHPRKNVEAAIGAVGRLRAGGLDAALVQVGGLFTPAHRAAIAEARLDGAWVQESSVSEADLVAAYHAADVLVLPSTFEGYGLPALEAMAAGLPVVVSGAGGLREVAGDAGVVTGACSDTALAEALGALLADAPRRAALIARGRARAATLTWERVAEATAAVYAELTVPGPGESDP
jgi:glycosyltransferase involved in cell wall biosynthesis